MCYTLQTLYVIDQSHGNWKQAFIFCKKIPDIYRKDCAMAIGTGIAQYNQDINTIKSSCEQSTEKRDQEACVKGVIGALGEKYNNPFEHVILFCSILDTHKIICYQQINDLMGNWTHDTQILRAACEKIPETIHRKACLQTLEHTT